MSAEWIFHSQEYNEWMAEEDYEVDENGDRMIHRHELRVEDLYSGKSNEKRPTKTKNKPLKRLQTDKSNQSTAKSTVLPKTHCPVCEKIITVKGLERHKREQHAADSKKFECPLCTFKTKRQDKLMDHQRRNHLEPVKKGRTRKNKKRARKRSPFRKDKFYSRHESSIKMLETNLETKEQLQKTLQVNEKRLKALEEFKKKNEIETRNVKTRVSIIESKQNVVDLPDVNDTGALLKLFNITKNCTKEDIRRTVNLRLMEVSPESPLSEEVFTRSDMTTEKKEQLTMFYNKASVRLLSWRKKMDSEKSK